VFLTHEGETPMVEVAAARQEVGELLAARRWNRLVVDITAMRSVPKAEEVFALGESLSQGVVRGARIALVVRPDQAKHARLIETVARNGGTFLTYFVDVDKAHIWVSGDTLSRRGIRQLSQPVLDGVWEQNDTMKTPTQNNNSRNESAPTIKTPSLPAAPGQARLKARVQTVSSRYMKAQFESWLRWVEGHSHEAASK